MFNLIAFYRHEDGFSSYKVKSSDSLKEIMAFALSYLNSPDVHHIEIWRKENEK